MEQPHRRRGGQRGHGDLAPRRNLPTRLSIERSPTMTAAATSRNELHRLFSFPNPVNEVSARLVASGVVLMSLIVLVFDQRWLTIVIAYGFIARVLTGPKLSPLGQLVTKVITP